MMRLTKQQETRVRNFEIMRLRGMYWTARRMFKDQHRFVTVAACINAELKARGAREEKI